MSTFKKPTRGIYVLDDLKQFVASKTYSEIVQFIRQIVLAVKGKQNAANASDSISEPMQNIYELLKYTFNNIQKFPPEQTNNRFGNKSYRIWHEQTLVKDATVQIAKLFSSNNGNNNQEAVLELLPYYYDSFGNATRIDFGTGHEVNFILFLL